jgi:surface antigen
MVVESVSGSTVHVSQYNFYGSGAYSSMDIQNSGVIYLRFPNA